LTRRFNWVKARRAGKRTGAETKVVSAEQISRLRGVLGLEYGMARVAS